MLCFAANSLLCRAALREGAIDPASFTAIRLATGAVVLLALVAARKGSGARRGSWSSAGALAVYAIAFSLAYVRVPAATGALLLFGCVQLTMMTGALLRGERPSVLQLLGWLLALGGMIVINGPGLASPPIDGALLMGVAGVAWGIYSLRGRGVEDPLGETAWNFIRTLPAVLALVGYALARTMHVSVEGALLAAASGALASGLGYAIWYAVVPQLGAARAASVQLSVPLLTALVAFGVLGESPHVQTLVGGGVIIVGLALALRTRRQLVSRNAPAE
jgi:drug/metabolite transporter (DMT)-like permease